MQATHRHTHRYSTLKRTEGWKREEVNGIIFGRAAPWGRLLPSGAESEHLKRLIKKEVKWLEPARLSVVHAKQPSGYPRPPPIPPDRVTHKASLENDEEQRKEERDNVEP